MFHKNLNTPEAYLCTNYPERAKPSQGQKTRITLRRRQTTSTLTCACSATNTYILPAAYSCAAYPRQVVCGARRVWYVFLGTPSKACIQGRLSTAFTPLFLVLSRDAQVLNRYQVGFLGYTPLAERYFPESEFTARDELLCDLINPIAKSLGMHARTQPEAKATKILR